MSEITTQIEAKLQAKEAAKEKTQTKVDNLNGMIEVYRESIAKLEDKIKSLTSQIERYDVSRQASEEEVEVRTAEVEHMMEILERVSGAETERDELAAKMMEMIDADQWMPGDPEEDRGKLKRDPEFKRIRNRKLALDAVIDSALADVNRIYYSRGEVSEIHAKGAPIAVA